MCSGADTLLEDRGTAVMNYSGYPICGPIMFRCFSLGQGEQEREMVQGRVGAQRILTFRQII